jgi:ribonuclease HII
MEVLMNEYYATYLSLLRDLKPDFVIGVDEVGIGCWAGPMVICAAAIWNDKHYDWLSDSKNLSRSGITSTASILRSQEVPHIMVFYSSEEVDRDGIKHCWGHGASEVIRLLRWKYDSGSAIGVVDGSARPYLRSYMSDDVYSLPKADKFCPAVQAAAILAKDFRDMHMILEAKKYPGYCFEKNVGYGTKDHREALEKLGMCKLHRRSYEPMKSMEVKNVDV